MPRSSIDPVVATNIKAILEKSGRSAYSVATALGRPPNWLYQVVNQDYGILLPTLREVAGELGVSVGELVDLPGENRLGLTDDPTPAAERNGNPAVSVYGYGGYPVPEKHPNIDTRPVAETKPGYNPDEANDQDGIWNLPIREVRPAAGSGAEVFGEEVVGYVPFRADWLKERSIDPAQADIVQVSGPSMEPTLPDGCSILVDRNRRELQPKCIYVLRNEDGLVVKRVDRNREGWWLMSDNPAWPPVSLTEDTDIVGEVRWSAVTH